MAATVLYDFERAMKKLSLTEQAVVALTVCEFSQAEIGALLDIRQQRVGAILQGRIVKDSEDKPVIDAETGDPKRAGGVVGKLTRAMNGAAA